VQQLALIIALQSFFAGLAASGALASALRLVTKAAFEKSHNGLRKGASMLLLFYISKTFIFNSFEIRNLII
jgi:equilibrative nucleoside transporter 1/2/3